MVSYVDIEEVAATKVCETGETIAVFGGVALVGAALWYFILAPIVALTPLASFGD